jgi:hypothetical protein
MINKNEIYIKKKHKFIKLGKIHKLKKKFSKFKNNLNLNIKRYYLLF